MSYNNVTTVMYGVTLNQTQMKALMDVLHKDDELGLVPLIDLVKIPMGYRDYTWTLYDAEIKSQGSDGRCDSLCYDENFAEHVFGINCGHDKVFENGAKMIEVIRNVPEIARLNFNQYCLPGLTKAMIEIEPEIILVNQIV
jgi:hypothetical protein